MNKPLFTQNKPNPNDLAFAMNDSCTGGMDISAIPLSLYIHVPWCIKKCPYCDFNSHAVSGAEDYHAYVDALLSDAKAQLSFVQDRRIATVFIGGGTPSLLPVAEFARLFDGLRQLFDFMPDCEITLEANPSTLEHAPFEEYLNIGINRLSIGIQSFDDNALTTLGRIHNSAQAVHAIKSAKRAGFLRVNADLMHGLPMQTKDLALNDLETAIKAGATHISWYQLTIEPNTAFYRRPPDLPDEDTLAEIEATGRECLLAHGFTNYEVSAWVGRADVPCQHNMNYWQFGDYLAIGAGGHGKVSLCSHHEFADGIYRFSKSRLPKDYLTYMDHPKFVNFNAIAPDELVGEYMMNALRLRKGVREADVERYTGLDCAMLADTLTHLKQQGLLVNEQGIICPTEQGFRYVNYLVQQFLD